MLDRIGHLIKRPGLPDPSYRFLLEAEPADEAVSLDCETTGFDPRVDEVVSIAAIRIAGRRILASSAFPPWSGRKARCGRIRLRSIGCGSRTWRKPSR